MEKCLIIIYSKNNKSSSVHITTIYCLSNPYKE